MRQGHLKRKRIVLVHWKKEKRLEVFSNLKSFCLSYPQYNYNTLNKHLGRDTVAYENEIVRVERKEIIAKLLAATSRAIAPVLRKVQMTQADDQAHDWQYWLSQPVAKRAEAVTFLVSQMLGKDQRMDKTKINKIKKRSRY